MLLLLPSSLCLWIITINSAKIKWTVTPTLKCLFLPFYKWKSNQNESRLFRRIEIRGKCLTIALGRNQHWMWKETVLDKDFITIGTKMSRLNGMKDNRTSINSHPLGLLLDRDQRTITTIFSAKRMRNSQSASDKNSQKACNHWRNSCIPPGLNCDNKTINVLNGARSIHSTRTKNRSFHENRATKQRFVRYSSKSRNLPLLVHCQWIEPIAILLWTSYHLSTFHHQMIWSVDRQWVSTNMSRRQQTASGWITGHWYIREKPITVLRFGSVFFLLLHLC